MGNEKPLRAQTVYLFPHRSPMLVSKWLFLAYFTPAIALGDPTVVPPIELNGKFAAADSLSCGDEPCEDAKECIAKLAWQPAKFGVQLEAAQPGCGDYLVRFPSPRPIGDTTNDVVSMEWFAVHNADHAIAKAAAIVVVHESGSRMTIGRLIGAGSIRMDCMRFYCTCRVMGLVAAKGRLVSAERFRRCNRQLPMCVARRDAVVALPAVDNSVVGVQGTSLGGFVTATVAGLDDGYDRVFIFLAGGDLQEVVLHGAQDAAKIHKKINEAGVTDEQIKQFAREVEPLRLAHRINASEFWLYTGKFDDVVPRRCSLALAKAAHLPADHHIEFPGDHYSGAIYLPQVVKQISERMVSSP